MRSIPYLLFFIGLLISCVPLREMNNHEKNIPSLADIGRYSKSLVHSNFYKIGNPSIDTSIALSVMEVPFTKEKFKSYMALKESKGEKSRFDFTDSIPIKPKYLCIEITDKIGMRTELNSDRNKGVLSYLEQDEDYRMVYQVSTVAGQEQSRLLAEASSILLIDDHNGQMTLEITHDKNKLLMKLSNTEIFDYKVLGFCWGESRYGRKIIHALTPDGAHCPKNTERKAHKLDEPKSYLKL